MKYTVYSLGTEKVVYKFDQADIERILKEYLQDKLKASHTGSWEFDWDWEEDGNRLNIELTHRLIISEEAIQEERIEPER